MIDIEHPHQGENCEICSLVENVIRPVIEFQTRKTITEELEKAAWTAMKLNEYNFNDTAVRAKTFMIAADIAKGKND